VANADNQSIELGVKFSAGQDGFLTGLRYYKATTSPAHVGSLWSSTGTLLTSATFAARRPRLAAGQLRRGSRGDSEYDVSRRTTSPVTTRPTRTRSRRRSALPGRALSSPAGGVVFATAPRRLPDQHIQRDQLLGQRRVQHDGHRAANAHANTCATSKYPNPGTADSTPTPGHNQYADRRFLAPSGRTPHPTNASMPTAVSQVGVKFPRGSMATSLAALLPRQRVAAYMLATCGRRPDAAVDRDLPR
jgi:hypothetical protein